MRIVQPLALVFVLVLFAPNGEASRFACIETVCVATESVDVGEGSCQEEDSQVNSYRRVVVGAHGPPRGVPLSVWADADNGCQRGVSEDGTAYHDSWFGVGLSTESPAGGWGVGYGWYAYSRSNATNSSEECWTVVNFVGNMDCPAGQRAPFIIPPLP